jgi:lysyl-tRNA synthetase class 2
MEKAASSDHDLLGDRQRKCDHLRDEFGIDPYGQRIDGLVSLAEARGQYDAAADQNHKDDAAVDNRPVVKVAGRVMQHRVMGNLIFMSVRDAGGDLQLAVSKKLVGPRAFKLAKATDLSDIVTAHGALGATKTGEISVWAQTAGDDPEQRDAANSSGDGGYQIVTKSLALPPGKFHGLQDHEQRYRKRYVDLYANPPVMDCFLTRSKIIKAFRDFLTDPPPAIGGGFVEVETPMMQAIPGGAAAKPFTTHHNALDMQLYMRIAPELYLKRLLVGGMSRVFEINRNFRNEGLSQRHNPEFTMLELYQAYGDYESMMVLTETLISTVSQEVIGAQTLAFGDQEIHYTTPFKRAPYLALFEQENGFAASDHERLVKRATELHVETAGKDHDVVLQEVWEHTVESKLIEPTFVMDYPASLCPLTKTKRGDASLAERFELYVCGMELANAYTELNDPQIQEANFRRQVAGLDEEEATFRTVDEDFLEALRVGMPPAGGLGIGIDRLVMLLTNNRSIRDVILFPLMRPAAE